jgi:hypothetical protein
VIKFKLNPKRLATFLALCSLVAIVPVLAFAQAVDPNDPTAVLGGLLVAFQAKSWIAAVGFASMLLVWVFRTFLLKKWAWAQTDRGGVAVSALVNLILVVAVEAISGKASLASLLDVLLAVVLSSGFYTSVKKVFWPSDLGQISRSSSPAPSSGPALGA